MLKAGLTGGIGSGKSMMAKVFSMLGVPVYNADTEAKKLLASDPGVSSKVKAAFGTLDRNELAAIVFNDKKKLEILNAIIHPAVRQHFVQWVSMQSNCPYVIKEAAVLFESGADKDLDLVINVSAPEELRIKRVMDRDGLNREQVVARVNNQMKEEERVKRSRHIIYNDELRMLLPQLLALHQELANK